MRSHEFTELGETFWPTLWGEDGHEHGDDLGSCATEHVFGQAESGDDGLLDIFEGFGRDEVIVEENVVLEDETCDGSGRKVFGRERCQGEDTVICVIWDLADGIKALLEGSSEDIGIGTEVGEGG